MKVKQHDARSRLKFYQSRGLEIPSMTVATQNREYAMKNKNYLSALDTMTVTFKRQANDRFVGTSPEVPELVSEGTTLVGALLNVSDAVAALKDSYAKRLELLEARDNKKR